MIDTKTKVWIEQTPNPNAEKFILPTDVISGGRKKTFDALPLAEGVPLAQAMFGVSGVVQVHFFQNVISVTQNGTRDWDDLELDVKQVLQTSFDAHDPNIIDLTPPKVYASGEIEAIDKVLDRTIRPGLQGDGGDLEILDYDKERKCLLVRYQGACGSCPSSSAGTLMAIQQILKDEYDPEIMVING